MRLWVFDHLKEQQENSREAKDRSWMESCPITVGFGGSFSLTSYLARCLCASLGFTALASSTRQKLNRPHPLLTLRPYSRGNI